MNERDNGPRYPGFRNSVDIYTAAFTPRSIRSPKRSSKAAVISSPIAVASAPHIITAVEPDAVAAGPKSATSTSTASSSSSPAKPIMTFFSRFGHKTKNRLSVSTESPTSEHKHVAHTHTRGNSLPNTPVIGHQHKDSNGSASIKHRISSPILATATPNIPLTRTESPVIMDYGYNSWPTVLEQYPLCVARIQAIRTTLLPQCTLSTEKLLRREGALATSKRDRRTSRVLQRSHAPTKSADLQWTKGLYILMPGLILRYTGHGTEDRIPERALQLTAGSLAFASDIIPGRPWVLQITRGEENALTQEATGSLNKRHSLVAKVTFRGNGVSTKAAHSVMFMVFESAEEMGEWMTAVRQEAMRLGGGSRPSIPREPVLEEEPSGLEEEPSGADSPAFNFGTLNNTASTLPSTSEEEIGPTTPYTGHIAIYPDTNSTDLGINGIIGLARNDPSNSSSDDGLSKRASTYTRASYSSIPSSSKPSSSHGGNYNQLSSSISSSTYSPNRASVISADRASLDFLRSSARPLTRIPSTTVTTVSPETSPERSTSPHSTPYHQPGPRYRRYSRSSTELRIPPSIPSPGPEDLEVEAADQPSNMFWMPRTPSPQPSEWGRRESTATTKTTMSTGSSLSPMSYRPGRRPVSMFPPHASTPIRRVSIRRRSMGAIASHTSHGHHAPGNSHGHPANRRLNSDQPISLHRRSRGASRDENGEDILLELGGPKFPPPSIPLPKVPDMKAERRGSRRDRNGRRRRASASTEASVRTHRTSEATDRPFFTAGSSSGDRITPSPTPISSPRMKPRSIIVEAPPLDLKSHRPSYSSSTPSSTPPSAARLGLGMERDGSHDGRFAISKRRSFIDDLRDLELGEEPEARIHRMEMEREREQRSEMRKSFAGMTPPAFPPSSPYGGPGSEALGIGSVWI